MTTESKGDAKLKKQPAPTTPPTPQLAKEQQEEQPTAETKSKPRTAESQPITQRPLTTDQPTEQQRPPLGQQSAASQSPVAESSSGKEEQISSSSQVTTTAERRQEAASTFSDSQPRQVIAVSASKNPAAFFNLARRFLVTDEYCDLSALEGAIVSAVDAAHLLERSKLANIVRIQTSYVTVEPRSKSAGPVSDIPPSQLASSDPSQVSVASASPAHPHPHQIQLHQTPQKPPHQGKKGNPLRRSRIIITVKRTEDYKAWLEENDAEGDHSSSPPA